MSRGSPPYVSIAAFGRGHVADAVADQIDRQHQGEQRGAGNGDQPSAEEHVGLGLGDQEDYAEYYLDAMGDLHDVVVANGGTIIGYWPNEGYDFEESKALTEDRSFFVGLALDEDRQPELTEERIDQWLEQILEEWEEVRS